MRRTCRAVYGLCPHPLYGEGPGGGLVCYLHYLEGWHIEMDVYLMDIWIDQALGFLRDGYGGES